MIKAVSCYCTRCIVHWRGWAPGRRSGAYKICFRPVERYLVNPAKHWQSHWDDDMFVCALWRLARLLVDYVDRSHGWYQSEVYQVATDWSHQRITVSSFICNITLKQLWRWWKATAEIHSPQMILQLLITLCKSSLAE